MSSADLSSGGRLIQVGAAAWRDEPGGQIDVFCSLLRPDGAPGALEWSERAFQVHRIPMENVLAAPPAAEVDDMLVEWLVAHGAVRDRRVVVPIGFNVGSFDVPFLRRDTPTSAGLLSRRALDLNALCFAFAGWDPDPKASGVRDFAGWKRSLKLAANRELAARGWVTAEHDAGFDAAQALVGLRWLQSQFTGVTEKLERTRAAWMASDPLLSRLGEGLLRRLASVPRGTVEQVAAALPARVSARHWFSRPSDALAGRSPLAALLAGDDAEVVAFAESSASAD